MADRRIQTWESKLCRFDYVAAQADTLGEDDLYTVHCLPPLSRWLILTLVSFYGEWASRWVGGWPEGKPEEVYAQTMKGLIDVMTCQTEVTRIADTMEDILAAFQSLNDRVGLGPTGQDLNSRLADIETRLTDIYGRLPQTPLDPTLIDQIEQILDGVGTVLGAAAIL